MEERAFELKAEILKALAQPTRLRILEFLRDGEKCICEIVPAVGGEQSNISRHISLMQKSKLVATRKDGVKVMVKVRDLKIFSILDQVSGILRSQMSEQSRLIKSLGSSLWKGWKRQNEKNRSFGNGLTEVQSARGASPKGSERDGNRS